MADAAFCFSGPDSGEMDRAGFARERLAAFFGRRCLYLSSRRVFDEAGRKTEVKSK